MGITVNVLYVKTHTENNTGRGKKMNEVGADKYDLEYIAHKEATKLVSRAYNKITESYFPNGKAEEVIAELETAIQLLKLYIKLEELK
jgi:hypothetical protein